MYKALTHGVQVTVNTLFMEEESDPDQSYFFWAYTIEILNLGTDTVQLMGRHWEIVADDGQAQVVDGEGVVGEQPVLEPGEAFEYTSGAPLPTASGMMRGHYLMETRNGEGIQVEVPAFSLDSPYSKRTLN
ncbi:MAG: Co2+/Mg2+ efflux protein ApaG [Rhodobiaceae bacterium]|nr:Co2+/Mg2+ efflux protein ApaG [Rhodobiaceae bacterium]